MAAEPLTVAPPAKRPCASCPYRRDVPSGVWEPDEYAKLPPYDLPTGEQPLGVFGCHQRDGRVCAGWAAVHDGPNLLALRMAVATGHLSLEVAEAVCDYTTDTPLFASGAEAAEHGLRELDAPSPRAEALIEKIERVREQRA